MEFWPILAAVVVAVLAITASLHAVLTRREVGTTVAWVGLIWLSPLIGAILYFLLGINRIRRRATALRGQSPTYREAGSRGPISVAELRERLGADREHVADIAAVGDRMVGRPLLGGNRFTPLVEGDEAYPAMLQAIRSAERSVSLTSYIFDNDGAGKKFVEALENATRRGVEVRVLVDAVGARYSFPPIYHALRRRGVRTARFMPAALPWKIPYLNLRSHRKIMVVDGTVGFTGGMNIREGFWAEVSGKLHGRDLHFRVEGPVVVELQEAFAEDWTFSTGERLSGALWFPPIGEEGHTVARGISDGPDIDYETLPHLIQGALASARRRVRIITPYFIPDRSMTTALMVTAMRGVEVTIILPAKGNLALVQWASTTYWAELLERGVRIVLSPEPFDHAKLMLVDDSWVLLGSANLDPRSLLLNFEFNVECYDAELAWRLNALVEERLERGREISAAEVRERPFALRLRDRVARLFSPYL